MQLLSLGSSLSGRRIATTVAAAAALLVAFVAAGSPAFGGAVTPGDPSGNGVQPVVVAGNPTCSDVAPGTTELKMDPPVSGQQSDGTLTVDVTLNGAFFDWTSNIGVNAVIAKGGPNANLYTYDPPSTGDTLLHAPLNGAEPFGLSHIVFCYGLAPPPPPPPPGGDGAVTEAGAATAVTASPTFTG
jgi:hypothetical protein